MPSCPKCQRDVDAEWRFCRFCGQTLAGEAAPSTASVGGHLSTGLLARRIQPNEMQGLLSKALMVEEGQVAVVLVGGRHDATLGAGKHSIRNVLTSRGRDTSVVLFRASDVPLDASVAKVLSSDPLPLALDLRLVLKIDQPILLWQNLVDSADSYSIEHLSGAVYPVVEEGCQTFVRSRSVRELDAKEGIREELERALRSHLEQPLVGWGISLVSLQAVSVRCEAWDKISEKGSQYPLAAFDEEVALEGRRRLFDVYQESEIQATAEQTANVAGIEKRAALWERMRQAITADARGELRSKAELEQLLRQADKDRLLQESEHEVLVRSMAEAKEDNQKARAFLLRRLDVEKEHELQKLELGHRFGEEQERLTLETSRARKEMEARWEVELRRADLEIAKERRLA